MKEIDLTKGFRAIVDDEDYEGLMKTSWCADVRKNQVYAARKCGPVKKQQKIYMHQQILNWPKGIIDHINGDPLDNRKKNLRVADKSLNAVNSKKRTDGVLSQYKGVSFDKSRGKWVAQINKGGTHHNLGRFATERDAALAYNAAAKVLFGSHLRLNDVK